MNKMQIGILVLVVIGLMLILNFLSWSNARVVEDIPTDSSNSYFLGSNFFIFIAGVLIVGVIGIWIVSILR